MKNLQKIGVQELGAQEMRETDGGIWWFLLGAIAGGFVYDVVSDPKGAFEAFKEGAESNF